jgi:hypothetical protein
MPRSIESYWKAVKDIGKELKGYKGGATCTVDGCVGRFPLLSKVNGVVEEGTSRRYVAQWAKVIDGVPLLFQRWLTLFRVDTSDVLALRRCTCNTSWQDYNPFVADVR